MKKNKLFKIAPEVIPLRYGIGLCKKDLNRPWILIETAYGDVSPGTIHLEELANFAKSGVFSKSAYPFLLHISDICDGLIQGTDKMSYSLIFRDLMAFLAYIHAKCGHFDGVIFIASCDKSIPAYLLALAKLNLPCIFLLGGVMEEELFTLEMVNKRGDPLWQEYSCFSYGACPFLGTACTMQILVEVLGLALPHSALTLAYSAKLKRIARETGEKAVFLVKNNITPSKILNKESIKNAFITLSAIEGSTNAILHLKALVDLLNIPISSSEIKKYFKTPVVLNLKPLGKYPASYFWYAGGVPNLIYKLKEILNLNVLTITGKTIWENLEELKEDGFFRKIQFFMKKINLNESEIIRDLDKPFKKRSGLYILEGNLANFAVAKVSKFIEKIEGKAKVFDTQEDLISSLKKNKLKSTDIIILRYQGFKASGMPELYYISEMIFEKLRDAIFITDGRFSGATRGFCIGHILPEAFDLGNIALVENDDIIQVDLNKESIDIIGIKGEKMEDKKISEILKERKRKIKLNQRGYFTKFHEFIKEVFKNEK